MRGGRRYGRGFAIGAVLAGIVFFVMITEGTLDVGHTVPYTADFYDVQAHRLLEGQLSMPKPVLGIEGYVHDGKSYMYFGPFPAMLRLPTAALTDSLDGHTAVASMSVAFIVAMAALGRISWRVRRWTRGVAGVDSWDEVLAGATAFVLGVGTTVIFLGLGPYVYHEASLWGIGLALAAFEVILAWVERPRARLVALASVLTLLSLLSRLAVGLGPAAALGLLGLAVALACLWRGGARVAARVGIATEGLGWGTVAALAAAASLPLAVYAAVNTAKFGTLFSLPFEQQAANGVIPGRVAIIEANGGTLFNLEAIPTNLWQYVRPDAFHLDAVWPWVRLPTWRPTVFGSLQYDMLDFTTSIPAAMPLLFVFAIGGIVAMARARARVAEATLASLDLAVLGAAFATIPSLVFLYITTRYMADFLPLLVLPALAALHLLVRWARSSGTNRSQVVAVSVVVATLALWSCVANVSLARDYQLARDRVVTPTPPDS